MKVKLRLPENGRNSPGESNHIHEAELQNCVLGASTMDPRTQLGIDPRGGDEARGAGSLRNGLMSGSIIPLSPFPTCPSGTQAASGGYPVPFGKPLVVLYFPHFP